MKLLFHFFRNLKLRKKLIASYTFVIIIPIVALGWYAYTTSKSYLEKQAETGMKHMLEQIALTLDEKMSQPVNFIKFMSFNPTIKKVTGYELGDDVLRYTMELNEVIEPTIWYYININREISEVIFYSDYTGRQIGNFVYPSSGVAETEWYKTAQSSNGIIWRYENGTLFAAQRILNSDNMSFAGVLYLKLDDELLFDALVAEDNPRYGIVIADGEENIIYKGLGARTMSNDILNRFLHNKKFLSETSNQPFMVSSTKLRNSDWNLYFLIPDNSYVVDTSNILKATLSIILLCFLVLAFFIWLFSFTLVRPIYALKRKIKLVEEGNFDLHISASSNDEVGELTASFGQMVTKVRELIHDLYLSRLTEKESELKALQAQINPHFLYNALSTINWKAIRVDSPEISKIANALALFYRTSLNKGKQTTTVSEEINNIRAYLDIQLIMHNHEFDVEIEAQKETLQHTMLNFLLQPLVENAILHGIDMKENGRGALRISVFEEEGILKFQIEDNGNGMSEEIHAGLLVRDRGGYGLRNVHERIQLFYGEGFGVRIESKEGTYTRVWIEIPVTIERNVS